MDDQADEHADARFDTGPDAQQLEPGKPGLKHVLAKAPAKAGFGKNAERRRSYLLAQQALRRFADRGYTLETDPEGVPRIRLPSYATRTTRTFDAMASAWPARRVTDTEVFGSSLRGWRERLGVTRAITSEAAEVSGGFVQSLEAGKRTVQFGRLLDVLDVLGLELVLRVRREPP